MSTPPASGIVRKKREPKHKEKSSGAPRPNYASPQSPNPSTPSKRDANRPSRQDACRRCTRPPSDCHGGGPHHWRYARRWGVGGAEGVQGGGMVGKDGGGGCHTRRQRRKPISGASCRRLSLQTTDAQPLAACHLWCRASRRCLRRAAVSAAVSVAVMAATTAAAPTPTPRHWRCRTCGGMEGRAGRGCGSNDRHRR